MFAVAELRLEASPGCAWAGLAALAGDGGLEAVSQASARPAGTVLAGVLCGELVTRDGVSRLAVRWTAAGPGGGLLAVLDADITLSAAGAHHTLLSLAGSWRPPPGLPAAGSGEEAWRRSAEAVVGDFIARLATAITAGLGPGPRVIVTAAGG